MDLFSPDPLANLLPGDGQAIYFGVVMPVQQADQYYRVLMESIQWKNDEALMLGKRIVTKRKVAWYGDSAYAYTYSNTTKFALEWTPELRELKKLAEKHTGASYNSCLLNLYHSGDEGMAWHSDSEKALLKNGSIASLSFGAGRVFKFKHKESKQIVNTFLEHGSLLEMKGTTQTYWLHRLPPTWQTKSPRINLTFRSILPFYMRSMTILPKNIECE